MTIKKRNGSDAGSASWPVATAKARLSELIDHAVADGPQTITRNGRETVVVVSVAEWERKTKRTGNLADFFAASPLRGSGLSIEREAEHPEPIELSTFCRFDAATASE
jgi:prevent-host-death family protein